MSELVPICGTSNPSRRGDVVFVHGLNGDARATWQPYGKPGRFWPSWLCEDMWDIGVWSVEYEANSFAWNGSTMALADRAINVLYLMDTRKVGKDKPVVFIAHSLGGLLVKEILRKATDNSVPEGNQLANHTRGVVFLSTPHSGSGLAKLVDFLKVLLPTESIRELKRDDPRLQELNTWYRNNIGSLKIETQVYCERKPTKAGHGLITGRLETIVVDANSSNPGIAGVTAVPMDDDHISISQPERHSELYLSIKMFVDNCLSDAVAINSNLKHTDSIAPSAIANQASNEVQELEASQVEPCFLFDAYISYVDKEPDATWVWETLLPRLENTGLKVAISGNTERPGVARVVNIEQGMRQAKRTIIVLSEAYLIDTMVEFENTLGQTMGIQEGTYRLLPVKATTLDNSRLPTRLSMLTTLDLSHQRRAENEFQRLTQALKSPLPKMGQ
jgi:TIR domain/Putative serine esterase (DUF676)